MHELTSWENEGGTPVDEYLPPLITKHNYPKRQWCGDLTIRNIEGFVARLKAMLAFKKYSFIAVTFGKYIDMRIHQELEGRNGVREVGSPENIKLFPPYQDFPHIQSLNVCDTYGVWSLDTKDTHFVFETAGRWEPERLTLRFKNGAGEPIAWMIAVEESACGECGTPLVSS